MVLQVGTTLKIKNSNFKAKT